MGREAEAVAMSVQFRIVCVVSVLTVGCQEQAALLPANSVDSAEPSASRQAVRMPDDQSSPQQTAQSPGHKGEQKTLAPLTWLQTGIADAGYDLSLGYRAEAIAPGGVLEPVVSVRQDGVVMAESRVIVCLLNADGEVLFESQPAAAVGESDRQPAHQRVQGVQLPEDVHGLMLRYRIQLPGSETESWYDVGLMVSAQ